jgi:hypothetical protein
MSYNNKLIKIGEAVWGIFYVQIMYQTCRALVLMCRFISI